MTATTGPAVPAPPRGVGRTATVEGAGEDAPAIRISQVTKRHRSRAGDVVALRDVSLEVPSGEFLCIVGASGCGKTTLLNLVAGLEAPTAGSVEVQTSEAVGPTPAAPGLPGLAILFQDASLFPWLTVRANVELPMKLRGVARSERRERATDLLARVHLEGFAEKRPHELSGGMRQRVALARALAQRARVLLMDEPFGALDAITRDLLHDELEQIWADQKLTVLFVTHNVREAVRLGDRVVLLTSRPGRVLATFPVELSRPRRTNSPQIAELAAAVSDELRRAGVSDELRRAGVSDELRRAGVSDQLRKAGAADQLRADAGDRAH